MDTSFSDSYTYLTIVKYKRTDSTTDEKEINSNKGQNLRKVLPENETAIEYENSTSISEGPESELAHAKPEPDKVDDIVQHDFDNADHVPHQPDISQVPSSANPIDSPELKFGNKPREIQNDPRKQYSGFSDSHTYLTFVKYTRSALDEQELHSNSRQNLKTVSSENGTAIEYENVSGLANIEAEPNILDDIVQPDLDNANYVPNQPDGSSSTRHVPALTDNDYETVAKYENAFVEKIPANPIDFQELDENKTSVLHNDPRKQQSGFSNPHTYLTFVKYSKSDSTTDEKEVHSKNETSEMQNAPRKQYTEHESLAELEAEINCMNTGSLSSSPAKRLDQPITNSEKNGDFMNAPKKDDFSDSSSENKNANPTAKTITKQQIFVQTKTESPRVKTGTYIVQLIHCPPQTNIPKGTFCLIVEENGLKLTDNTTQNLYWPYNGIRRFGIDKGRGQFLFEAGRRCENGPGLFTFQTDNHVEIYMNSLKMSARK